MSFFGDVNTALAPTLATAIAWQGPALPRCHAVGEPRRGHDHARAHTTSPSRPRHGTAIAASPLWAQPTPALPRPAQPLPSPDKAPPRLGVTPPADHVVTLHAHRQRHCQPPLTWPGQRSFLPPLKARSPTGRLANRKLQPSTGPWPPLCLLARGPAGCTKPNSASSKTPGPLRLWASTVAA